MRDRLARLCNFFAAAILLAISVEAADWRQFRGNDTTSVAPGRAPLTNLDSLETAARWRTDLPGRGLSGPVLVDGRVYVTASSGVREDRLHVLAIDAATGAVAWRRQFWATGRTMCHPKMCNATPTPCSDGARLFAFYSSNDLICLDLEGNLLWYRGLTYDYPNASNSLGMASSPVFAGQTLVVMVENDAESFTVGIDPETGEERWKLDRPKMANWTSPAVLRGPTSAEDLVLIQSGAGLVALEPDTGKQVWKYEQGCSTIPSAAVGGGMVFVPSFGLTAFRVPVGQAAPEIAWREGKLAPSTPSPIYVDGIVYAINRAGAVSAGEAATGKVLWGTRLTGPFSATPVAAGGHLYCVNEEGKLQVLKVSAEKGEVVGEAELGEPILATPAIVDGALFVRGEKRLWKLQQAP